MLVHENDVLHIYVSNMEEDFLDAVYRKVKDIMQSARESLAVLLDVQNAKNFQQMFRLQAFLDRLKNDHSDTLKQRVHVLGIVVCNGIVKRILKPHLASFVGENAQSRVFIDMNKARAWVIAAKTRTVGDEEFCDSPC